MMSRLAITLCLAIALSSVAYGQQSCNPINGRLPKTVIPQSYYIELDVPVPGQGMDTQGQVSINVTLAEASPCILLHADKDFITPSKATFTSGALGSVVDLSINFVEQQYLNLGASSTLPPGPGVLVIAFDGKVNSAASQSGLFISPNVINPEQIGMHTPQEVRAALRNKLAGPSKKVQQTPEVSSFVGFQTEEQKPFASVGQPFSFETKADRPEPKVIAGETEMMFATQFESSSARLAFPCFDEPAFKAYWSAKISVPTGQGLTVLFNTEESGVVTENGRDYHSFISTLEPFSSYLNAIAVGRFDYEERTANGIRFRVFTPPGYGKWASFSLNVTVGIIEYWSNLWKFPYTKMNKKLDQIPVPAFLDAMENQGLCTYYTPWLLVNPDNPTLEEKQAAAEVVIHELSHQWFGDTVTCPWWDDIYLQEGFARYFQYTGAEALFPSWDLWTNNASTPVLGMLSWFDWPFVQAIDIDIEGLAAAVVQVGEQEAYRPIYYPKGAAINRMFNHKVGDTVFNTGLSLELNNHPFSNPNVTDLMQSFQTAGASQQMVERLQNWLFVRGMPVVSLSLSGTTVTATQKASSPYATPGARWWINLPCFAYSSSGTATPFEFDFDTETSSVTVPADTVDFQCNIYQDGSTVRQYLTYVVLNYESAQFKSVFSKLPSITRAYRKVASHNVFNLVRMTFQKIETAIEMTSALSFLGTDPVAYQLEIADLLQLWHNVVVPSLAYSWFPKVQTGFGAWISTVWNGINSASNVPTKVVTAVAQAAVTLRVSGIVDTLYQSWEADEWKTSPLSSQIIYAASTQPNDDNYNKLYAIYQNGTTTQQADALFALSAFDDLSYCTKLLSSVTLQPSDTVTLTSNMLAYSPKNCKAIAWQYFSDAADKYWQASGAAATGFILAGFGNLFTSSEYADKAIALLEKWSQYVSQQLLEATKNKINIQVSFAKNNEVTSDDVEVVRSRVRGRRSMAPIHK